MTRTMQLDGVADATGRTWDEWRAVLDGWGAGSMTHRQIARRLQDDDDVAHWWAQTLTVAYEQHIGRRVPGQASDGTFQTSTSRTVAGDLDDVFARWLQVAADLSRRTDAELAREPATSDKGAYRYWRVGFADGSRVELGASQTRPDKVRIALGHERLPDASDVDRWRSFWRSLLAEV
ncbi:MAG TPA: hypothetical protein VK923_01430 [Euzebyales bacterium]|nr:hypothetical protein [Euzebyales bacterium]